MNNGNFKHKLWEFFFEDSMDVGYRVNLKEIEKIKDPEEKSQSQWELDEWINQCYVTEYKMLGYPRYNFKEQEEPLFKYIWVYTYSAAKLTLFLTPFFHYSGMAPDEWTLWQSLLAVTSFLVVLGLYVAFYAYALRWAKYGWNSLFAALSRPHDKRYWNRGLKPVLIKGAFATAFVAFTLIVVYGGVIATILLIAFCR